MKTRMVLFACCVAGSLTAENWPHWRGPNHDGISSEKGLPTEWSAEKNLKWKLALPGIGSATPVVWGDKIFLTCATDKELLLLCASTEGKELWRRVMDVNKGGREGERTSVSPSPSTDGKRVYTLTGTGVFSAHDMDGKPAWQFNVEQRYGRIKLGFGFHTTPLLHEGRLYLPLIHSGGAWVVAINAASGEEVWKVDRKSDGKAECEHSYTSPCLWRDGAKAYLITHGNDYAVAHRLTDGGEIWRLGDLNPKDSYNSTLRFVASPVAVAGLVVIPTAKNRGVVGVKPTATGYLAAGAAGEQWRLNQGTPDVTSPLIFGSEVYLCRENGTLVCLDAATGKQHYAERVYAQTYRGSPVAADGNLYLTARDGMVSVVKAGTKFEVLAKNKLPDQLTASPVIANGRIYLRGFEALYAVGVK
ncbi:MAG: pyrrolo-quinoline quinone [Pedosphaera sp.]|nr:pyrrolo-quinoline quinone [Pedosphaera sp.]MSU44316.1 pyrrolo-quinoline quinone [Pedosphaera sp.]